VRDKLARDDDEIASLEKKLGLRGKRKLPKAFEDEGLDILMDGLDGGLNSGSDDLERKEERAWLERKRRKARGELESQSDVEGGDGLDGDLLLSLGSQDDDDEEGDFSGFDSDSDTSGPLRQAPRARENPYIAPTTSATSLASTAKYIPPSLRNASISDSEIVIRLRRQVQGLLNRLSEANLISILGDVERLYRDHPRQHVTSTLLDLLIGLVSDRTALSDTFLILHAGFITAIYKVTGTNFGAQVVERIVLELDQLQSLASDNLGKETINLITLLSLLYNFQVITSNAIFDHIRLCLSSLNESSTELLLKIIRSEFLPRFSMYDTNRFSIWATATSR
jgi:nucleolar MIF4G domain-containing protein 1